MIEALAKRVNVMAGKAYGHGRKTAEVTILADPLPWTRTHFAEMADRMADHWIGGLADYCDGDDEIIDAVCKIAASARQGFIERVAEIMKSSAAQTGTNKPS